MTTKLADQDDQVILFCKVTVAEPDIHDPSSDARRLVLALADQHAIYGVEIGLDVLQYLQRRLRQGYWTVTVAINNRTVVAIYDEVQIHPAGLAIDVGTSSIELQLNDLVTGRIIGHRRLVNPLIRFGADQISRIAYGMGTEGGYAEMTALLRSSLMGAIGGLVEEAGLGTDALFDAVLVASPVTHHVLLGLDPSELGSAPYTAAVSEPMDIAARDLGLRLAPGALVHVLPLLGGHVGSDCLSAAYGAGLGVDDTMTLLIDIGTTTEIVLGTKGLLLAAAPPAGSALEGIQIEAGRHAVPGAIDAIRLDPIHFEPRFRVVGSPLWSDDPGFAASVEPFDLGGFCNSGLIDALAELRWSGLMGRDGALDPDKASVTPRLREEYRSLTYLVQESGPRIAMTQHDIRALQMAKAAVQAAVRILQKRQGGRAIERVVLTGGPGTVFDPLRAAVIGLFPDCDLDRVHFVEHAALAGARLALFSRSARSAMAQMARKTKVVETVLDPDFQMEQIGAMGLPHSRLGYPLLGARIDLADNVDATRGRRGARRDR